MHFEPRLWQFTKGVRLRILSAVLIGLASTCFGIARLALLGWLIGRVFAGDGVQELMLPLLAVSLVVVLRGALEYWRAMVAHETAAKVQLHLRRLLFDKVAQLGPSYVGRLGQTLTRGLRQLPRQAVRFGILDIERHASPSDIVHDRKVRLRTIPSMVAR